MNSYPRPVPPGAEMPAGAQAQTCARCHTPGRAVRRSHPHDSCVYGDDEANAETTTVLQMHVSRTASSPKAIHWHANPNIKIEYIATDAERQTIPYVRVTDAGGQVQGLSSRRIPRSSRFATVSAHHGLHRLSQHRRSPDFADA